MIPPPAGAEAAQAASAIAPPLGAGVKTFRALLVLLALAWIGTVAWSSSQAQAPLSLGRIVSLVGLLSAPLALLGLLWLLFGRSSRRETERFTRAVEAMRSESVALESVLGIVAARLEENHAKLRGEAEKLMSLGDEAAD